MITQQYPHLTLPYLWGVQAVTPVQHCGRISSAYCTSSSVTVRLPENGHEAVDSCKAVDKQLRNCRRL